MKMKFLKTISLATLLLMVPVGCAKSNTEKPEEKAKIGMVLDLGGVNDQSFNEIAWKGALKAKEEYGVDVTYLESAKQDDYAANIETAMEMDCDLIIGVGFNLTAAIEEAAKNYPDQKFAIVDGSFEEIPSNVTNITFNEKEAGYLAGVATAKSVDANKFGFVGGYEIPAVVNFRDGFEEGLLSVNKDAELITHIANSFTDAAKGKVIGKQLYTTQGVQVCMVASGNVNAGVIEAAAEEGKYVIGVDMAQNHIYPDVILTSALKNVDVGVKSTIKDLIDGKLVGGEAKVYDLSNGGVGFEKTDLLSKEVIEFVEEQSKK